MINYGFDQYKCRDYQTKMQLTIPNQLTILRIFLTPVFVWFILKEELLYTHIATIIFFFASFTDWYDGYFARRYNLVSRWGQFMDPLADKILVSAALFVFAHQNYAKWWMVILVVFRDFLITFLRSFALSIGKPIITSTFAKWKTFTQMGFIFSLMIYVNFPQLPEVRLNIVNNPWGQWTTITFSVVVLLTILSGVHYITVNLTHIIELWRRVIALLSFKKR
jgi:CDP-diacylglycerol--glycerol-3-phosphate 3-phosphatidyltransferase